MRTKADGGAEPRPRWKPCDRRHWSFRARLERPPLAIGIVAADARTWQAAAGSIAARGAQRFLARARRSLRAAALRDRRRGLRSALPRGRRPPSCSRRPARALRASLAGVAHRLGGAIDTHITALASANGSLEASRWFYRQRIEAVLSARGAAVVPAAGCGHSCGRMQAKPATRRSKPFAVNCPRCAPR